MTSGGIPANTAIPRLIGAPYLNESRLRVIQSTTVWINGSSGSSTASRSSVFKEEPLDHYAQAFLLGRRTGPRRGGDDVGRAGLHGHPEPRGLDHREVV